MSVRAVATGKDGIPVSTSALYTLQYMVATPLEKIYSFTLKPEVEREVTRWVKRYIDRYTDKRFKKSGDLGNDGFLKKP